MTEAETRERAEESAEVAVAIAAAEQPKAHLLRSVGMSRLEWLWALEWVRRLIPLRLGLALGALRGRWRWRYDPEMRFEALRYASFVVGARAESGEVVALARRAVIERAVRWELSWRPWSLDRMEIDGLEHLTRAVASRKGAIVMTAHTGGLMGLAGLLARRSAPMYILLARRSRGWVFEGLEERLFLDSLLRTERAGSRLVTKGRAYPVLRALLERGESCFMAFDVRGGAQAVLFDRPVGLASGVARLSRQTGCPVVPAFGLREGTQRCGIVLPPVEPEDFASVKDLHAHLAAIVDRAMRAHPEQGFPPAMALHRHPDYPSRRAVEALLER